MSCGYVYNPEVGDKEHGVTVETLFENLPDTWKCPVCKAPKDMFEEE